MARRKTKSYPESFRREAVRLADQPDRTATDVAKELGIHVGQIYNWRTQFNKLSASLPWPTANYRSRAASPQLRRDRLKQERDTKKPRRTSRR
jgi:transposase